MAKDIDALRFEISELRREVRELRDTVLQSITFWDYTPPVSVSDYIRYADDVAVLQPEDADNQE